MIVLDTGKVFKSGADVHRLLWEKQELHKDDLGLESCDSWHSAVSLLKLNPLHEISNVHTPLQVSGEELGEDKMTDLSCGSV